jgi:hypothetical protein
MKFELNFNWVWVLHKARLVFLVGIFYVFYTYLAPVWAFMWALYFILNDLSEIINDIENIKEERAKQWKNILPQRKAF